MISRVCIVTNYRNTGNYGAVLQAYALNKKINSMGFDCETLNFSVREQNGSKRERYLNRIKKGEINCFVGDIKRDFCKAIVRKEIKVRRHAFDKFKESIPHTKFYSFDEIEKINGLYDCYICGSDQIWRPTFEGNLVGIYWLNGINGDCVKASYAASMGVDFLPDSVVDDAKRFLQNFTYISVRENTAKEYLSKLTDREIEVSIDPVFLLNKLEWDKITRKPQIAEPYVFVYMIHGSKNLLKSITEYARLNKLKIVTFPYMAYYFRLNELNFGDIKVFDAEPSDFLGYIKGAQCVFTDSFHATAFSVIYHKCFFVSSANEKAFSRIENLLSLCGLDERKIPATGLKPEHYLQEYQVNWEKVDRRLGNAVLNSQKYLIKVLGV